MSKPDSESKSAEKLLKQIRDLMVLQLRQTKVPTEAIGNILGISAKTVRNTYPIGKGKSEDLTNNKQQQDDESSDKQQSTS